jgi:hypothetical protein
MVLKRATESSDANISLGLVGLLGYLLVINKMELAKENITSMSDHNGGRILY